MFTPDCSLFGESASRTMMQIQGRTRSVIEAAVTAAQLECNFTSNWYGSHHRRGDEEGKAMKSE